MKRLVPILVAACLVAGAFTASSAAAAFDLREFDLAFSAGDKTPAFPFDDPHDTRAGGHPYALTTSFGVAYTEEGGEFRLEGDPKDLTIDQLAGFVGDPRATPRCTAAEFITEIKTECPDDSAVGVTASYLAGPFRDEESDYIVTPVYNLEPSPGVVAKLGFSVSGVRVVIDVGIKDGPPYNVRAALVNIPQVLAFSGSAFQLWGNPADSAHDSLRGRCADFFGVGDVDFRPAAEPCEAGIPDRPFLTMPTSCAAPLASDYAVNSWQVPDVFATGSVFTHDAAVPPNPEPFSGCALLPFGPTIVAQPTSKAASSPTGLDFTLDVKDEGLTAVDGLAASHIRKAVVTLPEGVTINPSSAEGLETCTEAELAGETAFSDPGEGCPGASKIGTAEVETPLLEETLEGTIFVATPHANLAEDSLIALYLVIKNANLGIVVKQALKVEPDPSTGQLVTTADEIPQLPFSSFQLHFREGARSPLIGPPRCGTHSVEAVLSPRSGTAPVTRSSTFQVISGPNEGPCPAGGVPPFTPGFEAGSLSNSAGAHTPFYMRLTRKDGDQDMTKFSSVLPPGVLGKLAGVGKCSDGAIAQAKARAGLAELASPSCPQSSKIGRTMAGAGVGSQLVYVPGSLYLAGPYKGAPLSVVAIVPAVAGPFDVGTVVVREALSLNPLTAEVEVDGAASDPIPHILEGIPLKLRDLRVYVDRPDFILNPTSCAPSATRATLFGSHLSFLDPGDDLPVSLAARFQAADCASLGFRPRLALRLKGGTVRGGHPALTGTYRPRAGDANLSRLVLRLPRSAFLDQAHIRTICTRVQFAADACPPGAIYGHATAYTPLLDEPLSGPVYLRSSDNNLPDFVADLHGVVNVEAVARIDSVRGGIRATFAQVPDAPLSKVVVRMQGGRKGLIVNSTDLCAKKNRANARFAGHNGRRARTKPLVSTACRS